MVKGLRLMVKGLWGGLRIVAGASGQWLGPQDNYHSKVSSVAGIIIGEVLVTVK